MLPARGKTRQHCCAPRAHNRCFWRFSETSVGSIDCLIDWLDWSCSQAIDEVTEAYTSELVMRGADYRDDGFYQCIAKNQYGVFNSKMAQVTVLGKSSIFSQVFQFGQYVASWWEFICWSSGSLVVPVPLSGTGITIITIIIIVIMIIILTIITAAPPSSSAAASSSS